MSEQYLYQKLDTLKQVGFLKELPEYIKSNLNNNIVLRDYQEEAFRYFITYVESDLIKNKQIHNLFHMATGSGKTVIMAGLILYFYMKGYRKFLFFVNQNNIIEKTKENFLNPFSIKYLFANNIELMGEQVEIKEVDNFAFYDKNAINICFTSTQKLHLDMNIPRENSPTIEDFEDEKIVLISDESHHINTVTKGLTKVEKTNIEENVKSWEYTIDRLFRANRDNVLLEFTATADLKDPNVEKKYLDKIVYDYTLSKFRASGYTKDFKNMQGDYDRWTRTLLALVLSEYRRHLFGDAGQNIKPVVLLKSKTIKESKEFYDEFYLKLNKLKSDEIIKFKDSNNEYLQNAIEYFLKKDSSLNSLVSDLKLGFSRESSIVLNSKSESEEKEKQVAVNSLEAKYNPYRIIFTVDMLNEGWDVLNLFDIVRLYETRDGNKGKPGKTTISEAQLIGRGARYCPFKIEEDQARNKRKYDYDITNENRILETLLYHSMQDSRYISELRYALKQTGLLANAPMEIEYRLKDEFKESEFFKKGHVFSNQRREKLRNSVSQIDKKIQDSFYQHKVASGTSVLYGLFDEGRAITNGTTNIFQYKFKEIPLNITEGAMANFEILKFKTLKSYFPNLKSKKEFLQGDNYLGNITLQIESYYEKIRAKDLYDGSMKILKNISSYIQKIKTEYEGTREFYVKNIRDVLKDKKIYIDNPHGDGLGISQTMVANEDSMDLAFEPWYVYNDNYGTTEEKAFVKYFKGIVKDLRQKYDEIYLVRNERIPALAIYEFDTGERFEPDFLLFLQKKGIDGYLQEQIYIEPKGSHLIEKDKWKEEFLLKIEELGIPVKKYVDDNEYKIIGLPFFNKDYRMEEFKKSLDKKF
ncbi:DEAD/DEAH box helicase family protein [Peptoniphilus sp.]|uniref:DEAD/DEAH box helicase family protein n=1 Tax=Peptoniphilus sp. TaxID=1971214 RepID=UPI002A80CAF1|nr:DEAD/DEAH box helicase family protein [Peptoniphilus sp.]MDY3902382.1 DEAD/DEAH box helicase family protein [Peptoniphilus sp.]